MKHLFGFALGFGALILAALVVMFLGGLASAAWEIRQERKAGKVPTRPAWENREKRKARGGWRGELRVMWANAYHPVKLCWCGYGPLQVFPALDANTPEGVGCAAVEAGLPDAVELHDLAGGYARTPVDAS